MQIQIDKRDLEQLKDFMKSEDCDFVTQMNKAGLTIGAMSVVLNAIYTEIDRLERAFENEDAKI